MNTKSLIELILIVGTLLAIVELIWKRVFCSFGQYRLVEASKTHRITFLIDNICLLHFNSIVSHKNYSHIFVLVTNIASSAWNVLVLPDLHLLHLSYFWRLLIWIAARETIDHLTLNILLSEFWTLIRISHFFVHQIIRWRPDVDSTITVDGSTYWLSMMRNSISKRWGNICNIILVWTSRHHLSGILICDSIFSCLHFLIFNEILMSAIIVIIRGVISSAVASFVVTTLSVWVSSTSCQKDKIVLVDASIIGAAMWPLLVSSPNIVSRMSFTSNLVTHTLRCWLKVEKWAIIFALTCSCCDISSMNIVQSIPTLLSISQKWVIISI